MKKRTTDSGIYATGELLRRRAEEESALLPDFPEELSPLEVRQTLHELRVHQIQLEMQNEELRLTEEKLEQSRSRYFDLYNLAPVGYFTLSKEGVILEANFMAATQLGLSRSALLKRPFTRFILKDDQDIHYLQWQKLHESQGPLNYELRLITKEGTPFWGGLTATSCQEGDAAFCRIVVSDITKNKLLSGALSASEERFRLMFLRHSAVMLLIDPVSGAIVEGNNAASRFYGYSRDELRTMCISQINCLSENVLFTERQRVLQQSENYFIFPHRLADGTVRTVEVHSTPIIACDKPLLFSIIHDITQRMEFEAELTLARQEADAANRAKSEFLANMSHDIRTPMNAVIGLGYLALQTELTPRQRDYLTKITTSAKGLLKLLNDILDLSKIEAGKLELEQEPFALHPLLERLLSLTVVTAAMKGVTLRLFIHPESPEYLVGDPVRLEQILLNLLGNAVKFTAAGRVELTVRPLPGEGERILLEFSVRDTGIGLTQEQAAQIFEAFTQGDGSTSRHFGGSGLGLNICRRLVALMGGEIGVTSELGKGSTFTCTASFLRGVPPATEPVTHPDQGAVHQALQGCRILVVEDQEINQQILRELLEQVGVSVTVASDGRQAVAAVTGEEGRFDLLLMDLQMPGLDGYEATLLIRRQWSQERLPIIAMTAHAMKEERERCLLGGMNDHLAKPVDPDRLYSCLMKWVRPGISSTPRSDCREEREPGMPTERGERSAKTLLIVDQDPADITLLNGMLPEEHTCLAAIDGATALELARRHQPDLILLDSRVPKMDGRELCRLLKEHPATAQIPVILLISLAGGDEIAHVFALGGEDYLAKPFTVGEVHARVNSQLQLRAMREELTRINNEHPLWRVER